MISSSKIGPGCSDFRRKAEARAQCRLINHPDDATHAWIGDNDLVPNDGAAIKRRSIAERDPVVSDARIRQIVSNRHALELRIRQHLPSLHVSEKCRFLESGDDIAGTFVATPSIVGTDASTTPPRDTFCGASV
jgi:hypothetical protein